MRRNILIILGCVILSAILVGLSSYVILLHTGLGGFFTDPAVREGDHGTIEKRYGDPFELFDRALKLRRFVALPIVALAVGAFAGYFAKARVGLIACIGILPVEVWFLSIFGIQPLEVALGVGYFALAYLSSIATFRIRHRRTLPST